MPRLRATFQSGVRVPAADAGPDRPPAAVSPAAPAAPRSSERRGTRKSRMSPPNERYQRCKSFAVRAWVAAYGGRPTDGKTWLPRPQSGGYAATAALQNVLHDCRRWEGAGFASAFDGSHRPRRGGAGRPPAGAAVAAREVRDRRGL